MRLCIDCGSASGSERRKRCEACAYRARLNSNNGWNKRRRAEKALQRRLTPEEREEVEARKREQAEVKEAGGRNGICVLCADARASCPPSVAWDTLNRDFPHLAEARA